MSDPIRELELAEARLASLETQLATMAELNASQREILSAVAAQRDAVTAETTEQAWEIAKLRYYVEALERIVTRDQRDAAAQQSALAAEVDRYGSEQWNRGDAGRDWQSFDEWRRTLPRR